MVSTVMVSSGVATVRRADIILSVVDYPDLRRTYVASQHAAALMPQPVPHEGVLLAAQSVFQHTGGGSDHERQ